LRILVPRVGHICVAKCGGDGEIYRAKAGFEPSKYQYIYQIIFRWWW
jgi:hypothetical protein